MRSGCYVILAAEAFANSFYVHHFPWKNLAVAYVGAAFGVNVAHRNRVCQRLRDQVGFGLVDYRQVDYLNLRIAESRFCLVDSLA
jgi:hypothetical protein